MRGGRRRWRRGEADESLQPPPSRLSRGSSSLLSRRPSSTSRASGRHASAPSADTALHRPPPVAPPQSRTDCDSGGSPSRPRPRAEAKPRSSCRPRPPRCCRGPAPEWGGGRARLSWLPGCALLPSPLLLLFARWSRPRSADWTLELSLRHEPPPHSFCLPEVWLRRFPQPTQALAAQSPSCSDWLKMLRRVEVEEA